MRTQGKNRGSGTISPGDEGNSVRHPSASSLLDVPRMRYHYKRLQWGRDPKTTETGQEKIDCEELKRQSAVIKHMGEP